jgi:hypothetical protein
VSINPGGKLAVYDSPWGSGGRHYFEPFAHPAIKGGQQWNTLTLRLRKRWMEVLVNGEAVIPPIATDYDLLPSTPQIAIVKGDGSRLRAEFDRVQVRKLLGTTRLAGGSPARILYTDDFEEPGSAWLRHQPRPGDAEQNAADYQDGYYYYRGGPGWKDYAKNDWMIAEPISGEYQVDLVGRLAVQGGAPGAWGGVIVREDGRGLQVLIDRAGQVRVVPSVWDDGKYQEDRSMGPVRLPAIRRTDDWNTLTLRVRGRRLEILVNGQAVGEPFEVDYDLLPSRAAFAAWKPDLNTTIQAEFDRVQVRLLP